MCAWRRRRRKGEQKNCRFFSYGKDFFVFLLFGEEEEVATSALWKVGTIYNGTHGKDLESQKV